MVLRRVLILQTLSYPKLKIILTMLSPKLLQPYVRALPGRELEADPIEFRGGI